MSTTTAILNGTVNANSAETTATFEYGTDTNYGSTITAAQNPVTGTSDTAVSASLSGLTAETTYHYRVKAVNSIGTVFGSDMSFTTAAIEENDGVSPSIEDGVTTPGGGNKGDGNGDGTPDKNQVNVTSLPTINGNNEYATLDATTASGASLEEVKAVTPASVNAPDTLSFPYGLLEFKVTGIEAGSTITLSVLVDLDTSINSYMKKNMLTGNWDNIATEVDHTSKPGKTKVTFTIKDGGPYDEDGTANGTIVDAGGVSPSVSSVPDVTTAYYALLLLLLAGAGMLMLRRSRR